MAVLLLSSGCSLSEQPRFRLNTEGRDPGQIGPSKAEALTGMLQRLFGTPDRPAVPDGVPLDLARLEMAAGAIGSDAEGNPWGLYRKHCSVCHGISGDGAGPNAALMNPYPRDFRNGVYKYTSTMGGAKVAREDLERIIRQGMPGTAMPSFDGLGDREVSALVEYVQYLSIRGETELYLLRYVVDEDAMLPLDLTDVMESGVLPLARLWTQARSMIVDEKTAEQSAPPVDTPETLAASVARGRQLFAGKNARCIQCHGPEGNGDGEQSELYDDWNKPKKGVTPVETHELGRRFQLPIQQLKPRDFTAGVFHGGSRPIDQYWRIHVGIKGTPMPEGGPRPGSAGVLKPEEIWDLVHYVRWLGGGR